MVPAYSGKPALLSQSHWKSALAFSPNAALCAVGGEGIVTLWKTDTPEATRILAGKRGASVEALCFSSDGAQLVVCFEDEYKARVYDVALGTQVCTLDGDDNSIEALTRCPESAYYGGGNGWTGKVRFWEEAGGALVKELPVYPHGSNQFNGVAFSPDGHYLVVCREGDDDIRVFRTGKYERIGTLWGHTEEVKSVIFAPNGATLASCDAAGMIRLWDVVQGCCVKAFEAHKAPVNAILFANGGRTLFSASSDATVRLWDLDGGESIRVLEHDDTVEYMALSGDDQNLITDGADNAVVLWDLASSQSDLSNVEEVGCPAHLSEEIDRLSLDGERDDDAEVDDGEANDDADFADEVEHANSVHEGASDSESPMDEAWEWPFAMTGNLEWSDLVSTIGAPTESSILTDEEWATAKRQGRVVSILSEEDGLTYRGVVGLAKEESVCRVVFATRIPTSVTVANVDLDNVEWDFSRAAADAANATGRLLSAAAAGDLAGLKSAIRAGADVNYRDWERQDVTPLKIAVVSGHTACVEALIDADADISHDTGVELWRLAVLNRQSAIATLLERHAVRPALQDSLIQASHEGLTEVVNDLLARGADINASGSIWSPYMLEGTPLSLAGVTGNPPIISTQSSWAGSCSSGAGSDGFA